MPALLQDGAPGTTYFGSGGGEMKLANGQREEQHVP
jgi:hypothetical protein